MKQTFFIMSLLVLSSCNKGKITELENRIKKLENQSSIAYAPGFGEMMSNIQAHHEKLWFAGINSNWKLASFEIKELNEIIEDITLFQKNRSETAELKMIIPPLEEVNKAIHNNDLPTFKLSYVKLTQSCNNCHQSTNFGFNVVKVPLNNDFSNQKFSTANE